MRYKQIFLILLGSFILAQGQEEVVLREQLPHYIVKIEGSVIFNRSVWANQERYPLQIYTPVYLGDFFYLENSDAKIEIVCADLDTKIQIANVKFSGVECPNKGTNLNYKGVPVVNPSRSPILLGHIPTVLFPRATKIITNRPTFEWVSVVGASSYKAMLIDLYNSDENIYWETAVDTNKLDYPKDVNPLQINTQYLLEVIAYVEGQEFSSKEEDAVGISFSLLDPEKIDELQDNKRKLEQLKLDPHAQNFLEAKLYAKYELYQEALDTLMSTVNQGDFSVQYNIASLYWNTQKPEYAIDYFEKALLTAQNHDNFEGEAETQLSLANIFSSMGEHFTALKHYKAALTLYEKFGDQAKQAKINKILENYQ